MSLFYKSVIGNLKVPPQGESLLVSDGGSSFFRFVKCCLVYLWVRDFEHNRYIFGVADKKI